MSDLTEGQSSLPVKIIGSDSSGLETNFVGADSNGNMQIIAPSDGPVTPGTAATKSVLIGGQFNTSLPTLTNTQQSAIQLDSSGRQIIAPLTNASIVKAQLQDNAGTAITLGQKAMASSVPVVIASDQSSIPVAATQSGTWTTGRTWTLASGTDSIAAVQSGTWTVQPGNTPNTTPWLVTDSADGPVTPGTVAGKSQLMGVQFNTALPTLTNGQQAAIQADSSARIIIAPLTNSSIVKAQLQDNAGAAITLGQKVMASSVPVVIASDQASIPVAATQSGVWSTGRTWTLSSGTDSIAAVQSGTWTVQQGTPPWSVAGNIASGVADAGSPVKIGGVFNTTQPTVTTGQRVDSQFTARGAMIVATGTDAFNVTNISGTISLPTGAATSANQATEITSLQLIDNPIGPVGAGTAGTNSFLIGGVFNTSLPTLTNGQQAAAQFDSSGRLIISPTSTLTVGIADKTTYTYGTTLELPVGGVFQDTSPTLTAGQSGAHRLNANRALHSTLRDATTDVGITSASNGNATPLQLLHIQTPDTSVAATALGALNAATSIAMAGLSSAGMQLAAGTLIGTLVLECSLDGGLTYPGVGTFYDPSNSTTSTSIVFGSANGAKTINLLPVGGSSHIRIRVSAYTSGTANAILRASMVQGAAGAITAAAFGTVVNTYISLATNTTTQLLTANANRKYAYISNNSGGLIAIQFGSATGLTSAARGLVIPNGQYYELKGDNLYTGAIFAYTNSSGLTIAVTEGTP